MLVATIRKDIALLLRDRGRLLSLFALPVIFMLVFGSMFHVGPDQGAPRAIALWAPAGDPRGPALAAAIADARGFTPAPRASAEAARAAVTAEEAAAAIVVPASGPIEVVIDLAGPVQVVGPLQGALTGVVRQALVPPLLRPPEAPVVFTAPPGMARPLDDLSAFQVTVPGNAVLFAFFISLTVAIAFASERHTGVWRRLLAAPVPRWRALIGKLVPYYVISLVQLAFLFGLAIAVFGMRVAGSPLALVALCLVVGLCAVAFGFLVASFGGTEKQIGSTVPVLVLVMGLLGGCMFPRVLMPALMREIGLVTPHAWALDGFAAVLVRQGTSLADVAGPLGALLGFTALFLAAGAWRFRFEE